MLRRNEVRSSAVHEDGSLMYPGVWLETWALMAGTSVWILIGFEPEPMSVTASE